MSGSTSPPLSLGGPHNAIRALWDRLHTHPAGPRLFSMMMSRAIPYTGSISPRVLELRLGFARVAMTDRPKLRNHLNSLHAIALANLAEYTGNLALAYSLPDGSRFIVKSVSIDYLKKARGRITAQCNSPVPTTINRQEHDLLVVLCDEHDQEVARSTLRTLIGPIAP